MTCVTKVTMLPNDPLGNGEAELEFPTEDAAQAAVPTVNIPDSGSAYLS